MTPHAPKSCIERSTPRALASVAVILASAVSSRKLGPSSACDVHEQHERRAVNVHIVVAQHPLHTAVFGKRFAQNDEALHTIEHEGVGLHRETDSRRRVRDTDAHERGVRQGESSTLLANQIFGGHANLVETDLARRRTRSQRMDSPYHFKTRRTDFYAAS